LETEVLAVEGLDDHPDGRCGSGGRRGRSSRHLDVDGQGDVMFSVLKRTVAAVSRYGPDVTDFFSSRDDNTVNLDETRIQTTTGSSILDLVAGTTNATEMYGGLTVTVL
jgi:hypothetical protein